MCIHIYTVYIYVYIYIYCNNIIYWFLSQRFTKHIKIYIIIISIRRIRCLHILPYLMICWVFLPLFFGPVPLWHSDYSPRLVLDFCGLAKVTATFLVWIWDPRTVNELDIVRGLASFFGFTYGASFERLKNTMVIFSPKCWVALPEAFFQQNLRHMCQKRSVSKEKCSSLKTIPTSFFRFAESPAAIIRFFAVIASLTE